ncbi:MAG: hypothetical protein Q7S00_00390, partial [bacterium]|nr:hypothetical protein [bacterium]
MFNGKAWKKGKLWLVEIPALDLVTQGKSRKNAIDMVKDAIEELVDEKHFQIKITSSGDDEFVIWANDVAPLLAL